MEEHLLVKLGRERFHQAADGPVHFVDDVEANNLLNDLEHNPHAFVLACCMDRQTKAERAWVIPYKINEILGDFSIETLASVSRQEYQDIFEKESLHRFNEIMSGIFYEAAHRIQDVYDGDASKIWADKPSSATVVYRFLEFRGVGVKIATMAANMLARQLKVPFSDYYSIDISPDTHVKRVMGRMGLVGSNPDNEMIICKVRKLSPEFPGVIDFSLWEIGRTRC